MGYDVADWERASRDRMGEGLRSATEFFSWASGVAMGVAIGDEGSFLVEKKGCVRSTCCA